MQNYPKELGPHGSSNTGSLCWGFKPSQGMVAPCIPPATPVEMGTLLCTVPTTLGQEPRGVRNLAAFIGRSRSVLFGLGSSSFADNTWLKPHKTEYYYLFPWNKKNPNNTTLEIYKLKCYQKIKPSI